MTTTIDALVEALERLAEYTDELVSDHECRPLENARAALALARAEQAEPVLCVSSQEFRRMRAGDAYIKAWLAPCTVAEDMPLYTTPQPTPVAKLEPPVMWIAKMDFETLKSRGRVTLTAYAEPVGDASNEVALYEAAHNAKLSAPLQPDHFPDAGKMVPQPVQAAQVVGRIHQYGEAMAILNSVGRALPDNAPLYTTPQPVQAVEPLTAWQPKFEAISHRQETLVREFCAEIAGPFGGAGNPPDPVRLLEMAQALYEAERDDFAAAPPLTPRCPSETSDSEEQASLSLKNEAQGAPPLPKGGV